MYPSPFREQFLKPSGTIEGNYRDTFLLQLCNHGFNRRAPGRFQRYGKIYLGARSLHRDDTDTAGYLKDHLLDDDDKGLERFFDRHNHYTSLEPVEIMRERLKGGGEKHDGNFFERGPQRRRAFQVFGPALSAVPLAFLDGCMGLRYCLHKMFFECQIVLKAKEMRDPNSPLDQKYKDLLG